MKHKLNIKLNELNARELDRTEKQMVKGGEELPLDCCGCGCCWEFGGGGVDRFTNAAANHLQGKETVFCEIVQCATQYNGGVIEVDNCGSGVA